MTAAPIRRRPRPELWLAPGGPPAAAPRRRPPLPTRLPQAPPVPLDQQLAALEAELRAWGREPLC